MFDRLQIISPETCAELCFQYIIMLVCEFGPCSSEPYGPNNMDGVMTFVQAEKWKNYILSIYIRTLILHANWLCADFWFWTLQLGDKRSQSHWQTKTHCLDSHVTSHERKEGRLRGNKTPCHTSPFKSALISRAYVSIQSSPAHARNCRVSWRSMSLPAGTWSLFLGREGVKQTSSFYYMQSFLYTKYHNGLSMLNTIAAVFTDFTNYISLHKQMSINHNR